MESSVIVGQIIKHRTLGEGIAEKLDNGYLSIRFENGLKTFVYPDAFVRFLSTDDPSLGKQIQSDLAAQQSEREKKDARKKEEEKYFSHGIVIPGRSPQQEEEGKDPFGKEESEEEI